MLKRFVTYIYQYDRGNRGHNVGFIKADIRDAGCRMELQLRLPDRFQGKGNVYLIVPGEHAIGIPAGEIPIRQGLGQLKLAYARNLLGSSGYSVSQIQAVAILYGNGRLLLSCWSDQVPESVLLGTFDIPGKPSPEEKESASSGSDTATDRPAADSPAPSENTDSTTADRISAPSENTDSATSDRIPAPSESKANTLSDDITEPSESTDNTLSDNITSPSESMDNTLSDDITKPSGSADNTLSDNITKPSESTDNTLSDDITSPSESMDNTLSDDITNSSESTDNTLSDDIPGPSENTDDTLSADIPDTDADTGSPVTDQQSTGTSNPPPFLGTVITDTRNANIHIPTTDRPEPDWNSAAPAEERTSETVPSGTDASAPPDTDTTEAPPTVGIADAPAAPDETLIDFGVTPEEISSGESKAAPEDTPADRTPAASCPCQNNQRPPEIQAQSETATPPVTTYKKIAITDIRSSLPKRNWYLCSNSFLIHGFFNYHYLILKTVEYNGQKKYYLGVPGVYEQPERTMAFMFGFPTFEPAHSGEESSQRPDSADHPHQSYETGVFGYWMLPLADEA